jgi:FAD:protein FMN transferase
VNRFSLTFLVFFAVALSGIGADLGLFTFDEPIMGTRFRIAVYAIDSTEAKRASDLAFARVRALNQIYSDYLRESEVMRLCASPAGVPVRVSLDLFSLLQSAQWISAKSDGAFDLTTGHLTHLWRRTKRQKELPSAKRLAEALGKTNWRWVELDQARNEVTLAKPDLLLDLGGIAKGRAADEALKVMMDQGMPQAMVIAGGDMAIGEAPPGQKGWTVQLKTSESGEEGAVGLSLRNCGVSTSGDLHQYVEIQGKRYAHIVDPKTGLGLTSGIACSVIAPNATLSDALATAVCVLGAEKGLTMLKAMPGHEARIIKGTMSVGQSELSTPGFPATEPVRN